MLNNSIIYKCFGLVIALMISFSLQAQTRNLTEGEYFWDTDPGVGNATAFNASDGAFDEVIENIINTAVNIPATTGIHSFNIRVKDAGGNWGPLFSTIINVNPSLLTTRDVKITAGEYYWDTDPGEGNGNAFFATDGTFDETLENIVNSSTSIPATTGLHSFHVRVQDVEGNWSSLFNTVVNVLPSLTTTRNVNIMAAEYFWDADPGEGNGSAFLATDGNFDETLENIVSNSTSIPATQGNHLFSVRIQDVEGNWGPVFSTVIQVLPSITTQRSVKVSAGEYYWDTDPGQGAGTAYVAFDGNFDETLEILTNSSVSIPATTGVHVLYSRSMDTESQWGPSFGVVVNILDPITTARNSYVKAAEYYFDTDPGAGNATPILSADGNFDAVLEAIVGGNIPSPVTMGIHALYIRTMDAEDEWGPSFGVVVNMDTTISGATFTTSVSGNSNLCITDTATTYSYNAVAHGTTFSWSVNGGTIVSGQGTASVVVQWDGSQPAYIRAVETNGTFSDSSQVDISYYSQPTVSASVSNTTICAGGSVILTGSGAQTYSWSAGVVDGVAFNPTATLLYSVTGTDANGCFDTDQITVNVNSSPNVAANASTTTVCSGGSVTLTGSGASTYSWDNGAVDGVAFNPVSTQTYSVTATDANGCTTTDQVTVNVGATPTVSANASSTTICAGESVVLTGSGASTYSWDNGVTDGTAFSPIATQSYTATGTDANGCSATDQVTVNVNASPTVVANATTTAICNGGSVILTGSGAQTYSWDNGVTDGQSFTPTLTQSYAVTGTDANGCTASDQVTVGVGSAPTVSANASSTTLCAGEFVTLTGSGAQTYSWDNGVTDGTAFSPVATQTYIVTGTDANGCTATDQISISVIATASVSANASSSNLCAGESVTLTGSGAQTYSWNNGVTDGTSFSPVATQTYTVTGTDANGCSSTDQVVVTVNNLPTVVANTNTTTVCNGGAVTLTGSGAQTYSWNNGVTDGVAFSPVISQSYTVTGTDANGCTATDQITVNIGSSINVTANTSSSTICAGDSVVLTGAGAQTYTWSNGVSDAVAFFPVATQTYTVTGTDVNGCSGTAQVMVTVGAAPNTSPISGAATIGCASTSATYSVVNNAGSSYIWSVPSSAIIMSGQGTNQIELNFNGNFGPISVLETDANGCVGNAVQLSVSCNTALVDTDKTQLKVYPNPTYNFLQITSQGLYQQAKIEVYNLQGQLIRSQQIDPNTQLNVVDWPASTYIGRVITETEIYHFQFEKYSR